MEFQVSKQLLPDAKKIRLEVFKEEQGFVQEFDEKDQIATHIVGYVDGKPAATCRVFWDGNAYHIGRFAVIKELRGKNYGLELMKKAEQVVKDLGGDRIVLSSQLRAKGFYEKSGYFCKGDVYLDEFCPHIDMQKDLLN